MEHPKIRYFRKMVKFAADYLMIETPFVLPDRRILFPMMSYSDKWQNYYIKYAPKQTEYTSKTRLKLMAFHEVGHILYFGIGSAMKGEYTAERFAHLMIAKFFPDEYYDAQLETMKDYEDTDDFHAEAYHKLLADEGFFGYDS